MILQCPSCGAQFNVSANAIPPEGRTVRCSKCAHEWNATPVVEEESMDMLATVPDENAAAPAAPAPAPEPEPAPAPAPEPEVVAEDAKPAEPEPARTEDGDFMDGFAIDDELPDAGALDEVGDDEPAAEEAAAEEPAVGDDGAAPEENLPDKFDDGLDDVDLSQKDETTPEGEEGDVDPDMASSEAGEGGEEGEEDDPDREDPEFEQEVLDELLDFEMLSPHEKDQQKAKMWPLIAAAVTLLIVAIIAALFAFRPALQSSMPGFYELMGMQRSDGLVLKDVQMRRKPSNDKARFVVEGRIVNEADGPRHVPVVRVAIMDKDGDAIMSREYEADVVLEPGAAYPFRAGRLDTTFVDRVDHLTIDMGDGVELMLR